MFSGGKEGLVGWNEWKKIASKEVTSNYYSYFARDNSRKHNFSKNKLQRWSNPIGIHWNNTICFFHFFILIVNYVPVDKKHY